MRVLFYIEPVTFRLDPLFVKPWLSWIAQIMSPSLSQGLDFGFASSAPLCSELARNLNNTPCEFFTVSPRKLLEQFDFDRHEYARDLYGKVAVINNGLRDCIIAIDGQFQADVVISFTQNRYLEELFAGRVLFWELSPFPRVNHAMSLFMDPMGHQVNSLPNLYAKRILDIPLSEQQVVETCGIWHEKIVHTLHGHPLTSQVKDWLASIRSDKKVALLALQPPDWPTYEAAWRRSASDQMIMQCAEEIPPDWIIVPVFHPDQSLPEPLCAAIEGDFPNIRFPPRNISSGKAEFFLPHVNAVVSISSSLAVHGIFHGMKVVCLGQGQFSAFTNRSLSKIDDISPLPFPANARLMAFLSNRYCHPFQTCATEAGYVARTIKNLVGKVDTYFDLAGWSPSRLAAFL